MADPAESTEGSSPPNQDTIVANMMQNPQVMAALQAQLGRVIGTSSGYIESLPKVVQDRIKALKNIQVSCQKLEAEFYRDVHALECKYSDKFKTFFDKRESIINGKYEPTEDECEWHSENEDEKEDGENEEKLSNELKDKATLEENKTESESLSENVSGIPEFWLTAMKNIEHIADMIQEHDEPILKSLTNIVLKFIDEEKSSEQSEECDEKEKDMGFVLEFHFAPNAYFNNSVLTKTYKLSCEIDKDLPFAFEGPEISSTFGCVIDWKKGKNVTVKVIKKKQKHKGKGQPKFVNKTVKNDSFFNFFAPPEVPEDGEMDEDMEQLLESDFEIGHYFRERLIPKAVLFFTGEALDEFDDDDEEDDDDDDDDDDMQGDEDDEEDPDYKPSEENPPECKQQ